MSIGRQTWVRGIDFVWHLAARLGIVSADTVCGKLVTPMASAWPRPQHSDDERERVCPHCTAGAS